MGGWGDSGVCAVCATHRARPQVLHQRAARKVLRLHEEQRPQRAQLRVRGAQLRRLRAQANEGGVVGWFTALSHDCACEHAHTLWICDAAISRRAMSPARRSFPLSTRGRTRDTCVQKTRTVLAAAARRSRSQTGDAGRWAKCARESTSTARSTRGK